MTLIVDHHGWPVRIRNAGIYPEQIWLTLPSGITATKMGGFADNQIDIKYR